MFNICSLRGIRWVYWVGSKNGTTSLARQTLINLVQDIFCVLKFVHLLKPLSNMPALGQIVIHQLCLVNECRNNILFKHWWCWIQQRGVELLPGCADLHHEFCIWIEIEMILITNILLKMNLEWMQYGLFHECPNNCIFIKVYNKSWYKIINPFILSTFITFL